MTGPAEQHAALEPLRTALLTRARRHSEAIRDAAEEHGRRAVDTAQAEADRLLADARAQGEAEGAALLATERAQTRRTARGVVLAAQRESYDDLRRQARDAVRVLLDDPANRDRLAATLRHRLGDAGAVVTEHQDGGLVARTSGGRSVDGSVGALVDTALAQLDVEQLWAPA